MATRNNMLGLALAAAINWTAFGLMGCGRDDGPDTTPPDHIIDLPNSQGDFYRLGVTDSFEVRFSEPVDTAALIVEFTPADSIGYRWQGTRRLRVFGTRNYFGTRHFGLNTNFSMTLKGLKDLKGNAQSTSIEYFRPYAWMDKDFQDAPAQLSDTLYRTDSTWADESPVTDSFVCEGSLDFRRISIPDHLDFKLIKIQAPDTVDFTLTTRTDLDIRVHIAGPFKESEINAKIEAINLDSTVFPGNTGARNTTGAQGSVSGRFVADLLAHKRVFDKFEAYGVYVVRLGVPQDQRGFYRLKTKVRKFKLH